ncbi:hypothetical protein [Serratia ficaria]|uniref:hypothetical protein n=1 Tax=Serratia ficaria TaxID=61651 RepID=UPI002182DA16|nr:hypothetical protein [Serratia ficaria]CAI2536119.1 Uncharacterised protein [Serratia ficaria]
MTFTELHQRIFGGQRGGSTMAIVHYLLDRYDAGDTQVSKEQVAADTGIHKNNVNTIAVALKEQGIIEAFSYANNEVFEIQAGRGFRAFYELTPAVLALYRRS